MTRPKAIKSARIRSVVMWCFISYSMVVLLCGVKIFITDSMDQLWGCAWRSLPPCGSSPSLSAWEDQCCSCCLGCSYCSWVHTSPITCRLQELFLVFLCTLGVYRVNHSTTVVIHSDYIFCPPLFWKNCVAFRPEVVGWVYFPSPLIKYVHYSEIPSLALSSVLTDEHKTINIF